MEKRVNRRKLPSHNLSILKELEPYLTVILQAKNKPPFVLKGLQNWQRAKLLLTEILSILSDAKIAVFEGPTRSLPPSYKSLIMSARILADTLENTLFDVWNIEQASGWIYNLNDILNPETQPLEWMKEKHPAKLAHDRFQRFITQAKTFGSCFLNTFKTHVQDSFNRWNHGLLVCFNRPFIPRTNNSLESYVYLLKNRQTKTSGRRNNHSTLRHQQCFRYVLTIPSTKQFITSCQHTPIKRYLHFRQSYFNTLNPIIKEHRIKRDFPGMLKKSFTFIRQEVTLSLALHSVFL